MNNKQDFKILSLSGGGYRGLYTVTVLHKLEKKLKEQDPKDCLANYFDLITGTSIGGIIALALAAEIPAEKIVKVFDEKGKHIFKKQSCGYFSKAKYSSAALRDILHDWFGDNLIGSLKHPVAIPAINFTAGKPVVFKTPHHPTFRMDWEQKIIDVALATSAAPTYFQRHTIGKSEYIDGGLFANSPSLIGLHEAEIFFQQPIEYIKILSIGTMSAKKTVNPKRNQGGLWDWGEGNPTKAPQNIMDITLSSQQLFMQQMVKHRIEDNLVIIDETLTHSSVPFVGLDETTEEAKKILVGNAEQSAKEALGKDNITAFLEEKVSRAKFFYGQWSNIEDENI
ncbi:CBASS cGAMP-activated phospholipase [Neisseria musculi]|uniref:Patatin-like phospholipase family protein n=1 Tax=Neisseria musculi TaxID=1815583 RepID=A0A7H1MAD3_9NEIS|nr:CBASS cGAMP-activated phospholipase [Neisseria musculi]QNT58598.1 patatin-like phospholipase family protein [Neisseria musculi]